MAVGDSSNLTLYKPRHAAMAAGSPSRGYANQVASVQQAVASRRRLPRTYQDFLYQRTLTPGAVTQPPASLAPQ